MIKVLLVDDEVLVRHDLQTMLPWESHGFVICGEAMNGVEALRMVEQTEPHIVVMDINMPGMDGTALCRALQENHPEVKKIVLSSYDTFDYVRDTLKNGAIDYILKHELDGRALLKLLTKARNELTEEAKQTKLWEAISPSVTQSAVRELLLGRVGSFEQLRNLPHHPSHLKGHNLVVAVLQIENFIILTGAYNDADKNKFIQSGLELCQRMLQDIGTGTVCPMDQGKFAIVFFFEQYSHHQIGQHVADALLKIRKALELYLDVHAVVGQSDIVQGLGHVQEAYEQTCKQLNQQTYIAGGANSAGDAMTPSVTLSLEHERKMMSAVKLNDETGAHAIIDEVFAPFLKLRSRDDAIQLLVNELIHIANKIWVKSGSGKEKYYEGHPIAGQRFKPTDHLQETLRLLKQLYSQLIQKLSLADGSGRYSTHVEMAVRYIKKHYGDSISLEQVAEQIGITTSYLSRLFREEIGYGFTEYLNRERIHAAQRFIESGDYKIKEIYEKVGFSSYNYFFKVFKDMTGLTPQSYGKKEQ